MSLSPIRAAIAKALAEQGRGQEVWPEVPEDLLAHLEKLYPPRCYDPAGESIEQHLEYAGKAALIADMRYHQDLAKEARNATLGEDLGKDEVEISRGEKP